MSQVATITHKRQLTIPAGVFHQAGLEQGQKVLVRHENGRLLVEPAVKLVEKLAGSIRVPKNLKSMQIDELIKQAKTRHFRSKLS